MQQHTIPVSGSSVYEETTNELHKLVQDEGHQKHIDAQFREVRGRETIRTHLTLKAVSDAERRGTQQSQALMSSIVQMGQELQERTRHLAHLIESFEATAEKSFGGVHDDLRARADGLASTLAQLQRDAASSHTALSGQVQGFQQAMTLQVQETRTVLANQLTTNRETLEATMRQLNEGFQATKSQIGAFQQGVTMQVQEARAALAQQNREETERVVQDVRQSRDEVVAMLDSRMNQADASFAALRGDVEVVKFLVMDLIKDRIGRADPKSKTY